MNDIPERVLNKDIWAKLDNFEDKFTKYQITSEHRLTVLETAMNPMLDDIDTLKKRDRTNNWLTAIIGTIAAYVGISR